MHHFCSPTSAATGGISPSQHHHFGPLSSYATDVPVNTQSCSTGGWPLRRMCSPTSENLSENVCRGCSRVVIEVQSMPSKYIPYRHSSQEFSSGRKALPGCHPTIRVALEALGPSWTKPIRHWSILLTTFNRSPDPGGARSQRRINWG